MRLNPWWLLTGSFFSLLTSASVQAGPKTLLNGSSHGIIAISSASENGQEIINTSPNCAVRVRFSVTGVWRHDPFIPWHDAIGARPDVSTRTKIPALPAGALVFSTDLRTGRLVLPRTDYVVLPRQSAYVLMNDDHGSYFDNEGALQLAWFAISDCK